LRFNYHAFDGEDVTIRNIEPYALKEFRYRWYIVGKDLKDIKIKTFGLDRLSDLSITKQKFEPANDFNVNRYYQHCFGIISPNAPEPSIVELEFKPKQGMFIKSLPLHESQEVISDTQKGLVIRLTVFLTYDFIMELLSYGGNVKVIKPVKLKEQVKLAHREGYAVYEG
jgi:predicted DNA-binding transcriptional regulator YafY